MQTCPRVQVDSIGEPLFPLPGLLRRISIEMLFRPILAFAVAALLICCGSWLFLGMMLVSALPWRRVSFALGLTPYGACSAALPKAAKLNSLIMGCLYILSFGL